MVGKRLMLFSQLILYTLIAACTPPAVPSQVPDSDVLFQTSTLNALSAGDFEGDALVSGLKALGNFGLGTFNALDGEMVILDGEAYQVRDNGVATLADNDARTPFAAVTYFAADQTLVLNETVDCPELQARIDSQLPALDVSYAVKVSGEFTHLKVRAPHKQSKPYPTLADALVDQALFESQNITGTMVGFRMPEYMAGTNSAGYHFHFISGDRQHGGHVLECQTEALTIQVDDIESVHIIDIALQNTDVVSESIPYGLLLPFSGQYAWLGTSSLTSVLMVENDVNSRGGGINGTPIEFIKGDTEDSNEKGAAAAQALIDEGAVALIGPTSLSFAGVMPLVSENQIATISPSAGTVELDRAGSDYFYRTVPSDSLGGRALALAVANSSEYLGESLENIVLMVTQEPAFLSFQEPIESGLANADGQLAGTVALAQGATSYADVAQQALSYDPDLIILAGDPDDSVLVMQETMAAGYTGRWFFTQDQTTASYIQLATPELVEGSFGLLEISAPESSEQLAYFNESYAAMTTEPQQIFASNTYDAVTVLALAMLRASIYDWEVTRATVNANIPLVANPGEGKVIVTSYLDGREVLMAGGEINYQGITGPIDFDEFGNIIQPYGIFQVQDGAWVQISSVGNDVLQTLLEAQ